MSPMDPNPFGEDRTLKRRARTLAVKLPAPTSNATTAARLSSAERVGRRAGTWAAQSRFATSITVMLDLTAKLTRPARDLTAKLKRSNTMRLIWLATLFTILLGSIVYSLVTGEGNGPG